MKRAFTLAEMLIVIVIIGLIATIATRSTMSKVADTSKALFQKTYMDFSENIKLLTNDSTFYSKTKLATPVLSSPGLSDEQKEKIITKYNLAYSKSEITDDNFLCLAMALSMGDRGKGQEACINNCNKGQKISENFILNNGTKIFGLCGAFNSNAGNPNFSHYIYLYTQADKNDKKRKDKITAGNIEKIYTDERNQCKKQYGEDNISKCKTNLFRVKLNANGKMYVDSTDTLEKILLSDREKNKNK